MTKWLLTQTLHLVRQVRLLQTLTCQLIRQARLLLHAIRYRSISLLHSSHIGSSPTRGFLLQIGHRLSLKSSSNMLFTPFNSSKHTLQYSSVCAIQLSPQRGHFLYFIRFSVSVVLLYDCAQIIATFTTDFYRITRRCKVISIVQNMV